jgi:site-specific DNA-methyltransferase (adenine-specific)
MVPATVDLAPEQILATLDQARQALATIRSLPDVKQIHDQAAALRHYTKKRKYALSVQNDAAEVTLRAFRRMGELLEGQVRPGNPQLSTDVTIGLHEVGISRNDSSQCQRVAALPTPVFDTYIAETKARGQELTSKGVRALARDYAREAVRHANVVAEQAPLNPALVTLEHGDFVTVGATIAPASVDAVICDPPYGDDWVPQLDALGALAARVLKPGGSLLVLYSQRSLFQAGAALAQHLTYQWAICYRMYGHNAALWAHKVQRHWKPLLWFVQGTYTGAMVCDVIESHVPEKDLHDWQQNVDAFRLIVKRFTNAGDLILDPCCGAGTTGVAAVGLRRRFLGIDTDAAALAQARARLAALLAAAA